MAYLDYNATTPVDERVLEAMMPFFREKFGNASSDHLFGWEAAEAVEESREQIARVLNARPSEILFTSGATEAANIGLFGFCEGNRSKGNHIISCRTEHKAILDCMQSLEKKGFEVTYLEVDAAGNIDLDELKNAITLRTILVCIMLANNETGLIHPIKEISGVVHSKGIKLMSDITQAVGKIPVDLKNLGIDLAVFSSHKIYGPKGVGALYLNRDLKKDIQPYIFGGGQQQGLRPGSLNVPGIVGFGRAFSILGAEMENEFERLDDLRNQLEERLLSLPEVEVNSANSERIPNTTNIRFNDVDGDLLFKRLNKLAISRGSACSSNTVKPSHVLKAMGLSDREALSSFRFSLGRPTSLVDIEFAFEQIHSAIKNLKKELV
ncbi:cysteine desulfurase [Gramella sp. GC03-9]|uniref:cysteine desulfurase n=1 Tax=Christiangramia oceanisediminis TaxID=2920386 RepID=A0A9X2I2D7_9FLAO|nr:cysteine desulfurase family protein [Gramella oceanisediminis]MCP9199954.1 cysteine desulfurase [Gramella oceanisediminis]